MTASNASYNPPTEDINVNDFHEMVTERAYRKAEKRGFVAGYETED